MKDGTNSITVDKSVIMAFIGLTSMLMIGTFQLGRMQMEDDLNNPQIYVTTSYADSVAFGDSIVLAQWKEANDGLRHELEGERQMSKQKGYTIEALEIKVNAERDRADALSCRKAPNNLEERLRGVQIKNANLQLKLHKLKIDLEKCNKKLETCK